jgi:hypothetical protein
VIPLTRRAVLASAGAGAGAAATAASSALRLKSEAKSKPRWPFSAGVVGRGHLLPPGELWLPHLSAAASTRPSYRDAAGEAHVCRDQTSTDGPPDTGKTIGMNSTTSGVGPPGAVVFGERSAWQCDELPRSPRSSPHGHASTLGGPTDTVTAESIGTRLCQSVSCW